MSELEIRWQTHSLNSVIKHFVDGFEPSEDGYRVKRYEALLGFDLGSVNPEQIVIFRLFVEKVP